MFRLMIADDEQWTREALAKIIRETAPDFQIEASVQDGVEVLARLREQPFDLIITDIRMPRMDGLELIWEMENSGIAVPVIILSGYSEFEYAKQAVRYNVFEYVLKPIKRNEIIQMLERFRQQMSRLPAENVFEKKQAVLGDVNEAPNLPGTIIVKQMEELIRTAYYEDHSLTAMGERFGLNAAYLGRLFQLETGIGFSRYLTNIRIEKAKQLLEETIMGITPISHQVGYWDDKHFIKTFKKIIGITPSNYRAGARNHVSPDDAE